MTSQELYDFLWDWATLILNTESGTSPEIPIIKAHQNSPAPKGNYLVIDDSPSLREMGKASSGDSDASGDVPHITDYEASVQLWEVNGGGDLLRALKNSLYRQTVIDLFSAAKVSFLRSGEIFQTPRAFSNDKEAEWIREQQLVIILGIGFNTVEASGWIQTVEMNNNIGGTP